MQLGAGAGKYTEFSSARKRPTADRGNRAPFVYFEAVLMFSPKNFQVFPSNFANRNVLNVE